MHQTNPLSAFGVRCFVGAGAAICLALAGCDELKVPEAINKAGQNVQQQVNKAVDTAKQAVAPSSGVELTLSPPVTSTKCFADWVGPADGRPGVLILATYRDPANEAFPSVYAQVRTDVLHANNLIGKVVNADVYIRRTAEGPVLRSTPEEPVQLRISYVDGNMVVAEVVKGSVVSIDTNESAPFLGKLTCRLQ